MRIASTLDIYMQEENIKQALDHAKDDGFDALGIVITEPIDYYRNIAAQLKGADLDFCVHSNLVDTNLASSNQGIRQESIKQVKEAIEFAKEIGAKVVTVHPGKFRNTYHVKEAYMMLDLSLNELLPIAEENGILLCMENMEPGRKDLCVTKVQVKKVLERHKGLYLTLDLAHVAMIVKSQEEMVDFYSSLSGRIRHFHISGFQPNSSHVEVSLKESQFDFSQIIDKIRDTDCILRIENRELQKNIDSLQFIKTIINPQRRES